MTETKPFEDIDAEVTAHFAAANCHLWAYACLRTLERALGTEDRIDRIGDLFMSVIALEQALFAARYLAANDDRARAEAPLDLDESWSRVREIRNAVSHMPERMGSGRPLPDDQQADAMSPGGLRAGSCELDFFEWESTALRLRVWARTHMGRNWVASGQGSRHPSPLTHPCREPASMGET